ncbi:TUBULIN FOLDING COFACTOR C [Salix purpurea]|uniref:TUBULIN FOLDING COFACTOR C n=3 Tax=Salix TaxID=40685 RepID=A0A9Q1AKU7_SALPP|nr:TUBULIN FOLDING COFACTOR C [Salix koriyanagi]KAJ6775049.1 TUBULIN FOLDING COFACTOR C [Salix purpurea]
MEEELPPPQSDLSSPNPSSSIDTTLQKKHQAMLDRLSNRHQSRQKTATTPTTIDSTASFLFKFTESKRSIESLLNNSPNTPDPTLLKSHLANISSSISSLEKLVAESSYFLPPYELRSSLKCIENLKQSLENLNSQLLPKKKFSFKNKSTSKPNPGNSNTNPIPPNPSHIPQSIRDSPGIRNKESQTLSKNFKNFKEIGEFTLSDLDSCEVKLIGCINALFVNKLRNCRVYTGPVIGSILLEEVENCVFVLASHQIRIHNAKGCDFYLRVRSRPIIEDCGGVRFAPYCLRYVGIEEDLTEAGLEEENESWGNVDDFKWLRAVKSPNWSVLEESERIGCVEIEGSGSIETEVEIEKV